MSKGFNKIIYQDSVTTKFLIESKKHGNFEVVIDTEDLNKINMYRWSIQVKDGKVRSVCTNKNNQYIMIHHLIIGKPKNDLLTDHINRNTLDNRKVNLRFCSKQINNLNRNPTKANRSGYKGIGWNKQSNKWRVRLVKDYKEIHIGMYDDLKTAVQKRDEAIIKYKINY